ncbi:polysaccharide deacetylase 2 family uncharacterized protein YibQ [Azospirillum fermentarium]|uniref:divergent polysaccharide deacetylase family protein n=1 Tax=Azospirillum fermentarium TaxID=1233114 RepID=UPI0022266604|nr:divergent polysaccharide deacetylase family protein [Azospirillum fermentarium]MCW2244695.1 polysaccharide deacetylase 2 family uncharacterized protein YibQ [Azospirillum fermentarium]
MNAAALLGRLKVNPLSRFSRKAGKAPPRFAGDDGAPRRPKPVALMAAAGAVIAALGGIAGWAALFGGHAAEQWSAAVPAVTVTVAAPPPPPAPAPPPAAVAPPPAMAAPANGGGTGGAVPTAPTAEFPLAPAPAMGLVEDSRFGPLPRTADDGRKPWQVYARPYPPADKRPRIAIVIADMGLSGVTTMNGLQKLPAAVTLSFVPYAERLDSWIERARTKGHEVMMSIPMEPVSFPRDDPGPNALLSGMSLDRLIERLNTSLGKGIGYVGITTTTGSKFTTKAEVMTPVIDAVKQRGLLFLDAKVAPRSVGASMAEAAGVPRAWVDKVIDRDLARGSIDDQLKELETIARTQGAAVGLGFPYPSTIERINLWVTGLQDRGIALVPVSAVVNMQKGNGG